MAYSESVETLKKILPLLQPLAEGRAWRWNVQGSAKLLAYKLREGLYIARRNPKDYPELAAAAGQFQIKVVDQNTVQAVQKQVFTTQAVAGAEVNEGVVVTGTEMVGKLHELVSPSSAIEVIQFWTDGQPSNGPFTFPNSTLNLEEMTKLYRWAIARKWLIFYNERRITLMRETRDLQGMNWAPEDGLDEHDHEDDDDTDIDGGDDRV